jgi:hypothetical protein
MLTLTKDGERTVPLAPRPSAGHRHRYRRVGDDWFGGSTLYGCSCGVVRAAP